MKFLIKLGNGIPYLKLDLKMKLTVYLFLISLFQIHANSSYSQNTKITLELENVTIENVLRSIEAKSDFKFLYNDKEVDYKKLVSINFKKTKIKKILDTLLSGTDIKFEVLNKQIILVSKSNKETSSALQQTVKGTVVDENGLGVPGASIIVKGTTKGLVTDFDGNFSIQVSPGDVLEVSFLGYITQSVTIGNQTSIKIVLKEDTAQLDEVVVVGYGTQKRSDIVGAISSVSPKDYEEQPIAIASDVLQGRSPGVQISNASGAPGSIAVVRIRGANSITNNSDPLYVIDGVLGASFTALNPADIQSIEILKDASSTGLYGSRGSNGVVMVTTKRGKTDTPVVEFNSLISAQYLPSKIDKLSAAQHAEVVNISSGTEEFSQTQIDAFRTAGGTDWQDEIYREGFDAILQNHNLSISGKSGKIDYYISGNKVDNVGILENSLYEREAVRANVNFEVNEKLRMGLYISYADELAKNINNTSSLFNPTAAALIYSPTVPAYQDNGRPTHTGRFSGIATSPTAIAFGRNENIFTDNTTFNFNVNWNVTKNIDYTFIGARRTQQGSNRFFKDDLADLQAPQASVTESQFQTYQHTHILDYRPNIGENHSLLLKGVFEETWTEIFGSSATATGLTNLDRSYFNLALAETYNIASGENESSIRSYVARMEYAYKNKYLLSSTVRQDQSSKFQNKFQNATFPSVALGWRVSEEPFLQDSKTLSNLKLRVSWGETGNEGIAAYSSFPSLVTGIGAIVDGSTIQFGVAPGGLTNDDLRWETTAQLNAGIDFGFWNNRFTASVDYYKKNTTDVLLRVTPPTYIGGITELVNTGEIENEGFEFMVEGTIINNEDFQWDAAFNISTNKATAISLGKDDFIFPGGGLFSGSAAIPTRVEVGGRIGNIQGYINDGVWGTDEVAEADAFDADPGDSKYRDVNGDGSISADDITTIGNGAPDFTWGLNNTLSYKNFTLNVFLQSMVGHDLLNINRALTNGAGGDGSLTGIDQLNAWTPDNQNTVVPSLTSNYLHRPEDSRYVEDATFIRFKNISLGYNLPESLLESTFLDSVKLILSAQNLITITDYKGYDPEVSAGGSSNVFLGYDTGVYPNPKRVTLGVNVKF
ncbi:TonB-dependent receptor [Flavivirga algicola]|uniref:TonB-dependent receptor n=1 Tax=Flavivirga algicola TaxID=2729136 RepID=A0ABX1S0C2_9FLAO|nr:TonB-dependent receptor [Flavivirga algicola]NMH89307.1 TonB-dependent receptor [Flavivirga algicola]